MSDSNIASGSLVITTNNDQYYVIPPSALEQFRATPEQKQYIDEDANEKVPGTFASLDASDASAQPNFASASEPETTALAWFQEA